MNTRKEWLIPGAKVRVQVQSVAPFEGTVEAVTDRGFYIDAPRELHVSGMVEVEPPTTRFIGWNLFQCCHLLEAAP